MGWLILICLVLGTAAWGAWRAAPYIPSRQAEIAGMMTLADIRPGERVFELGAGDGRVVLAAARRGAIVTGVEIFWLAWLVGVARIWFSPYRRTVTMRWADFFRTDCRSADVVICYLLPRGMKKLEQKFHRELRAGTRIIVLGWPMPGWPVEQTIASSSESLPIYRYRVPQK